MTGVSDEEHDLFVLWLSHDPDGPCNSQICPGNYSWPEFRSAVISGQISGLENFRSCSMTDSDSEPSTGAYSDKQKEPVVAGAGNKYAGVKALSVVCLGWVMILGVLYAFITGGPVLDFILILILALCLGVLSLILAAFTIGAYEELKKRFE